MDALRIKITDTDGIESAGSSVNRHMVAVLRGRNARDGMTAMLDGMQDYARIDLNALIDALAFCPELCCIAAAVHGLHLAESDETPEAEAIAILTKLRDSRQPEAIRTRAGNLLIDMDDDYRDQVAAHDGEVAP